MVTGANHVFAPRCRIYLASIRVCEHADRRSPRSRGSVVELSLHCRIAQVGRHCLSAFHFMAARAPAGDRRQDAIPERGTAGVPLKKRQNMKRSRFSVESWGGDSPGRSGCWISVLVRPEKHEQALETVVRLWDAVEELLDFKRKGRSGRARLARV